MKNYVQPGNIVPLSLPYARSAGQGVLVGALFGVCAVDGASGATIDVAVDGVFDITKATGAITAGARVYWDDTNKNITTTATSNFHVGFAIAAAASGDATARVLLQRGPASGA